jgi:hypothetical protein
MNELFQKHFIIKSNVPVTHNLRRQYYIYKGTGGLFHNLLGLSKAIELAINNKAILIIDMDIHRPFGGNFSNYFNINCNNLIYYDNYNKIPQYLLKEVNNIKNKDATYFGYMKNTNGIINTSNYNINHNKYINILYGYYNTTLNKNLIINDDLYNRIKEENNITSQYISVHFRNTDIKNNTDYFIKVIKTTLEKYNKINTIYLASDDYEFYDIIKNEFALLNIIRKTVPLQNIKNLHYSSNNSQKQMYECLQDIYNILKSDVFIPSRNSGFSRNIDYMIKNKFTIFPNLISNTIVI